MSIFITGTRFKVAQVEAAADIHNNISIRANFDTTSIPKKDNYLYFTTRAVHADFPNLNGDIFPLDELKKAYRSFIGRNLHLDHDTAIEKAVGKVFDAKLMHDANAKKGEPEYYVECLCGVDTLSAPHIAKRVQSGVIDAVSMGASVEMARCSICNKTATDPRAFCVHLQNLGKNDPVTGELCASINHGVSFTELSLVGVPADPKAKMNQVFASILKNIMKKADSSTAVKSVAPALPEKFSFSFPCSNEKMGEIMYNELEKYAEQGISDLKLEGSTLKVSVEAATQEDALNKLVKISEEQGLSHQKPLELEENIMADNLKQNVEANKKATTKKVAVSITDEENQQFEGKEFTGNNTEEQVEVIDNVIPNVQAPPPVDSNEGTDYSSLDKGFLAALLKHKDSSILQNIDMAKVEQALNASSAPAATPAGAAVNEIIVEDTKNMAQDKQALSNPMDNISPDMGIAKEPTPNALNTPTDSPVPAMIEQIDQTKIVDPMVNIDPTQVAPNPAAPIQGLPVQPAAVNTNISTEAKPEIPGAIPVTPPAPSPVKPEVKPNFNKGPEEAKTEVPGDKKDGEFNKEEVIKLLEDLKKQETSENEPIDVKKIEEIMNIVKGIKTEDKKEEPKKEEPKADDKKPSSESKEDKPEDKGENKNPFEKKEDKKKPENKEAAVQIALMQPAGKTAFEGKLYFKVQGQEKPFVVSIAELADAEVKNVNAKVAYLTSQAFANDIGVYFNKKKALTAGSVLEIVASYNQKVQNKPDEASSHIQTSNIKAPSETDKAKGGSKVEEALVGPTITDAGKAQKSTPEHKDEKASGHETSSTKATSEKLDSVEALQKQLALQKQANTAKDSVIEFFKGKLHTEAKKNLEMGNQNKMAQKLAKVRNIVDMTIERNLLQVNEDYRKEAFSKSATAMEASKIALQKSAEDLAADLLGLSDEELTAKAQVLKNFRIQADVHSIRPMSIKADLEAGDTNPVQKQIEALSANMQ